MTLKKQAFENIAGKGKYVGNQHFVLFPQCFLHYQRQKSFCHHIIFQQYYLSLANSLNLVKSKILSGVNPLPHMPILGSSNSAANTGKDMMAKIWKNGNTIIFFSRKYCGKRRNYWLQAISPFPTIFSKAVYCLCVKTSVFEVKG